MRHNNERAAAVGNMEYVEGKNVAHTRQQQTPYSVNQNSYVHIDRSDVSVFR